MSTSYTTSSKRPEPQHLSIGAHVAHVGTPTSRYEPSDLNDTSREIYHTDAAWSVSEAMDFVRTTIGHVELSRVTARVKTVSSNAWRYEADLGERNSVQ